MRLSLFGASCSSYVAARFANSGRYWPPSFTANERYTLR